MSPNPQTTHSSERNSLDSPWPPPSYRTMGGCGENDPLLGNSGFWPPPKPSAPGIFILKNALFIIFILVIGLQSGYIYASRDPFNLYDPQERAKIRKEWAIEHAAYTQNITRLLTEQSTIREQRDVESNRLAKLREEIAQEHHKWENERHQWEQERQRRESAEHERQRKYIQWGPLQRDREPCVNYGAARYQASLEYIPAGWDRYSACKESPVQIHGRDVYPSECRRTDKGMVGVWIIDFDEPACKPWWRDTKDHGCTSRQSGIHRYEAHLEGYLEPNEFKANWADMCDTTPHTMFGHTYKSPTECVYWPRLGVYGFWDVPDDHCR